MRRRAVYILGSLSAVAVLGAIWVANREATCRRLVEQAQIYGDAEVRRNGAGECYVCRPDGPLFDIVFDTCVSGDRIEWRRSA